LNEKNRPSLMHVVRRVAMMMSLAAITQLNEAQISHYNNNEIVLTFNTEASCNKKRHKRIGDIFWLILVCIHKYKYIAVCFDK
jgi:hypothetical protein